MQESVFLASDVDEASVESGHELAHLAHVDVAHGERGLAPFVLIFHEALVFKQRDGDIFGLDIDDYFACHSSLFFLALSNAFKERGAP